MKINNREINQFGILKRGISDEQIEKLKPNKIVSITSRLLRKFNSPFKKIKY